MLKGRKELCEYESWEGFRETMPPVLRSPESMSLMSLPAPSVTYHTPAEVQRMDPVLQLSCGHTSSPTKPKVMITWRAASWAKSRNTSLTW